MPARAWFLILLSALLQVLIFPNVNWFMLGWVAFVPWLIVLYSRRERGWRVWLSDTGTGWACGALWYLGSCYWVYISMRLHGGLSPVWAGLVLLLFCLYLGLYHALFAALLSWLRIRGVSVRWMVLATPVLWVAVELARSRVTSFPWDLLGYTQTDNLPLVRWATVTGVYALSFVVMLVNAVLCGGWLQRKRSWSLPVAGVAAAVALQAGMLVQEAPAATDHEAVLLQQNLPLEYGWSSAYYDTTIAALVQESEPAGFAQSPGEKLIVWPESPAPFFLGDARYTRWLDALAQDAHAWIIAGAIGTPPGQGGENAQAIFNSAGLVSPQGRVVARYDKVHLVPFGEFVPLSDYLSFARDLTKEVGTFSRGIRRGLLEAGQIRAGTFICYESVFPDEVRQFVKHGANVLVNLSNDGWFGDSSAAEQHLRMVRMRAIENHRWLLRATNNGITVAADPSGRVTQSLPREVRATLQARYALISGQQTFYTVHGDWFAYVCAILSVLALAGKKQGLGISDGR
jgi:apolipoprotein N-acyltransferase